MKKRSATHPFCQQIETQRFLQESSVQIESWGPFAATPDEQLWFGIFRLGAWPYFYEGVQFSRVPEALNQFFRQMVPNTGPYDAEANIAAVSELFNKIGKGVLVTHSQSGGPGWRTAIKNDNIRAIVSFEPGGDFLFPEGEAPQSIKLAGRTVTPPNVSHSAISICGISFN